MRVDRDGEAPTTASEGGDGLLPGLGYPQLQRLANGAELVSLPLAGAPLVCIDFWCRAGSA
ncbi:MAG: hypothetical protein ACKOZW_15260, partial [Cyanobium sp.]